MGVCAKIVVLAPYDANGRDEERSACYSYDRASNRLQS